MTSTSLSLTMINALFGFNQAMNNRLWKIITEHLTDAQFVQPNDYSRGSIRNQLVHMADAQRSWFRGLLEVTDFPALALEDYPTREGHAPSASRPIRCVWIRCAA